MPHSFTHLLHTTPELQKLTQKLSQLEQINQYLTAHIDPALAAHCKVANLRDGSLILSTTSPAWNHKLRFVSLDLLTMLRTNPNWSGLKSIGIRVDYLPSASASKTTPASNNTSKAVKAETAQLLHQTADGISCTKLAEAMHKLANKMVIQK